jgi:hypothetical protein
VGSWATATEAANSVKAAKNFIFADLVEEAMYLEFCVDLVGGGIWFYPKQLCFPFRKRQWMNECGGRDFVSEDVVVLFGRGGGIGKRRGRSHL